MEPLSVAMLGVGTARPAGSIAQCDAAEIAKTFCTPTAQQARLLPTLYGRTGVKRRGSVLLDPLAAIARGPVFFPPAQRSGDRGPTTRQRMTRYATEAAPLALDASRRALRDAALEARALTQVITVSCTGFAAPGVEIALIKHLGCEPTVGRTHVGFMGCHGAFNALRVAAALARSEASARILLCSVELCSLHFAYGWDPKRLVANALFADGSAALVLAPMAQPPASVWILSASGSCLFPDAEDAMTWRIGDHGFEMTLSPRVPSLIRSHLRGWLIPWLARQDLSVERIDSWAIHPGGPRILEAVADGLGLPPEATATSAEILAECGNMSSATLGFILERLRRGGASRPCLALGFGPGLVVEAALFL